jgi:hypothetical protein
MYRGGSDEEISSAIRSQLVMSFVMSNHGVSIRPARALEVHSAARERFVCSRTRRLAEYMGELELACGNCANPKLISVRHDLARADLATNL